jgi:hypothetical protein
VYRNGAWETTQFDAQLAAFSDPVRREFELYRLTADDDVEKNPHDAPGSVTRQIRIEARDAYHEATRDIARDLSKIYGFEIDRVWLSLDPRFYQRSLSVLLEHARDLAPQYLTHLRPYLNTKHVGPAGFDLFVELITTRNDGVSDDELFAYGDILATVATKADILQLAHIIGNPAHRDARLQPLLRTARWKLPQVPDIVASFCEHELNPDGKAWFAITALQYAKQWNYVDIVSPYLTSENVAYREAARKYVKAFEAARAAGQG